MERVVGSSDTVKNARSLVDLSDGGRTSYNKNVSGSAHFVRSDLHGLERSGIVSRQANSAGLRKDERICWGHVGNI